MFLSRAAFKARVWKNCWRRGLHPKTVVHRHSPHSPDRQEYFEKLQAFLKALDRPERLKRSALCLTAFGLAPVEYLNLIVSSLHWMRFSVSGRGLCYLIVMTMLEYVRICSLVATSIGFPFVFVFGVAVSACYRKEMLKSAYSEDAVGEASFNNNCCKTGDFVDLCADWKQQEVSKNRVWYV